MISIVPKSLSPIIPKSLGPWVPWLPLALFSVLWLDLIRQLSYEWSNREEYAYGWFVPFLALGLFWRRWLTRPKVGPLTTGLQTTRLQTTGPLTTDHGPLTCCPVVSSPSVPETLSPYVPESVSRITHHASRPPFLLSAFCFYFYSFLFV